MNRSAAALPSLILAISFASGPIVICLLLPLGAAVAVCLCLGTAAGLMFAVRPLLEQKLNGSRT